MNIQDYKFEIGDEVITTEGESGKIIRICNCDECAKRGFYEPIWIKDGNEYEDYISIDTAKADFAGFYRIGKYQLNDFDKGEVLQNMGYHEKELQRLRKQLRLIEEIENGN